MILRVVEINLEQLYCCVQVLFLVCGVVLPSLVPETQSIHFSIIVSGSVFQMAFSLSSLAYCFMWMLTFGNLRHEMTIMSFEASMGYILRLCPPKKTKLQYSKSILYLPPKLLCLLTMM